MSSQPDPSSQDNATPVTRAAVIGAGPIGLATAAHLSRQGLEVAICDVSPAAVEPMAALGHITLEGIWQGTAEVALATTDVAEAVSGAQLVVSSVPASAHEAVARAAAAGLEEGAVVLIQPGATLSAVAFMHAAHQAGLRASITPVETLNTLFTGRLGAGGPGHVNVLGAKREVPYAALPNTGGADCAALLEPLFEALTPCSCILEVSLHNVNAVMHPAVTFLNVGPIDNGTRFRYYVEGGTPTVMRLVEAVDRERMAILEHFDLPRFTVLEWYDHAYGAVAGSLYEVVQELEAYRTIASPESMNTRLLLEDVPTGLVGYCSIAEAVGVATPTMGAIVDCCCAIYGIDFWATGRTLDRLGLGGLDRAGLLERLGVRDRSVRG